MTIHAALVLAMLALPRLGPPRLTERPLGDIAVMAVPSGLKGDTDQPVRVAADGRVTFEFSSRYFWASFGSIPAYRQQLIVSVMAPDATDAEYAAQPRNMNLSYEHRSAPQLSARGAATLTTWAGVYDRGGVSEPSVEYRYVDKSRRLQIAWHAVLKEVDRPTALAQLERMAASFRLVRDPVTVFAAMRAAPGLDSAMRAGRVVTALAMLKREGFAALVPGQPVLRDGVYVEWMAEPEARYQLLVPLGRVRAAASGKVLDRPRPAFRDGAAGAPSLAGTLGWREFADGDWVFSNLENAYLPLPGTGAQLAASQQDRGFVYFHYVATVRVEEESDDRLLTSLRWFLDGVPDVRRRWREGTLVKPGTPERD